VRARLKVALDAAGVRLPTQQQRTVWLREPARTGPERGDGDAAGIEPAPEPTARERPRGDTARNRRGPDDQLRP
jgi:hypothetical protein